MIAVIDYGSGNVGAILNILRRHKVPHQLTGNPADFAGADRFILPGVGAFDPTMETLTRAGLVDALNEEVLGKGKKVLGICVGMHLLAEGSEEGELPGLGWVPGRVRKIDADRLDALPKLPHMGWNSIDITPGAALFDGVDAAQGFYFLHSYYFDATEPGHVAARTSYGVDMPCAVQHGNVLGVQFHPEKSHGNGTRLFLNFAEAV